MSVIEKVPFLHEIMIADAQELAQVISPGVTICSYDFVYMG